MKSISDLDRLDTELKRKIFSALHMCVTSGRFILGENVNLFEEEFAQYIGTRFCVSVGNGTDALLLALRGLGVDRNDEVITTANAGFYASTAILACGASPVYAEIDRNTYTLETSDIEALITTKTKAIILTHLFGKMGDVERLQEICKHEGVALIEDCAQSHGARLGKKLAGSFGEVACFSFYPTKNLGAMGDGGAVLTSDEKLFAKIKQLRQYGWGEKYQVDLPHGINSRLDEIQAAILRIKLPSLDSWNESRRAIARRYDAEIKNNHISRSKAGDGFDYVAHLYVIETNERASLIQYLRQNKIPYGVHYPIPDHRQPILAGHFSSHRLAITENVAERILTIPCSPTMNETEIDTVINALNAWSPK